MNVDPEWWRSQARGEFDGRDYDHEWRRMIVLGSAARRAASGRVSTEARS